MVTDRSVDSRRAVRPSVADHPWPGRRKALCAAPGVLRQARAPDRTAPTAPAGLTSCTRQRFLGALAPHPWVAWALAFGRRHAESSALSEAAIRLAHELEIQVIAEGVETEAQARFLASADCAYAQGYHYSRPVDAARATELLRQGRIGAPAQKQHSTQLALPKCVVSPPLQPCPPTQIRTVRPTLRQTNPSLQTSQDQPYLPPVT
jgi:hypothetical protein